MAAECLKRVLAQMETAAVRCGKPVVSACSTAYTTTCGISLSKMLPSNLLMALSHRRHRSPVGLTILQPRLVAVSKTKPLAAVEDVYSAGHRHFGENYVQELVEKAPALPADIRWHFIGQLQSNKAKVLVSGVPNLWAVESVDSVKLAGLLQKAAAAAGRTSALRVFVQVNTSAESQKGGTSPGDETVALCKYIVESCPALRLTGLMTIGKLGEVAAIFFERLVEERTRVLDALAAAGVSPAAYGPLPEDAEGSAVASGGAGSSAATSSSSSSSLELSMGMSSDFELAIASGSTSVRVGSAIFGAREYAGSKAAAAASEAAAAAAAAEEADESVKRA